MSTPDAPIQAESAAPPASSEPPAETQEQSKANEVAVEITDIKASGLPAKVGFFSGLFYVRVKGGKVPQRTKKTKYNKGDEFVASWGETVRLSGLESSKVEIEVYARRFFFSWKIIKKTESKESLADLLEHSETPVELELLEEGQAAGKLVFKISKSPGGGANVDPPAPVRTDSPEQAPPASIPEDSKPDM
ncbi:hypothetical protein OG21DRAFT_1513761 [Imleria badia]|nr:hypothetical protein OG21DRAFT_1513761 [Imleria badia]